jgi:hypothetical protein
VGNRETGGPEQRLSNAEQEIRGRASFCAEWADQGRVGEGAVCTAIAAIFAPFEPAASL